MSRNLTSSHRLGPASLSSASGEVFELKKRGNCYESTLIPLTTKISSEMHGTGIGFITLFNGSGCGVRDEEAWRDAWH